MIIKEGYWNYYLAFRISSYQQHVQEFDLKQVNSGIIAYVTDETVLVNNSLSGFFERRKAEILRQRETTRGKDAETIQQMYIDNELSECYFDFDKVLNDKLQVAVEDSIENVSFVNFGYTQILDSHGTGKCGYYVLMPFKVYFSEWEFIYCPVYIQLLTNGNGLIKLQIPIKNVLSEELSDYPIKRWFLQIKVWHELYQKDGENNYKILSGDTQGIGDIVCAMQNYVQNFFPESIVDGRRFLGFETIVISESQKCDINTINIKDSDSIEQVYRLVYPENFAINPDEKALKMFWEEERFDASGIHVICGDRARLVLYADVNEMLKIHNRKDVVSKNEYLNLSVAASFDPCILFALAHKDNEMTIFRLAEQNRHTINDKMIQYYSNANYIDSILTHIPKHAKIFYEKVHNMLDNCMIDFKVMLQRMQNIEEYEKTRLLEKQNATISKFTVIFTVLFGLPLIHETLTTIKNIFQVKKDIIPLLTTGHVSWLIWMSLVIMLIKDIIKQNLEYEGIGIDIINQFRKGNQRVRDRDECGNK